MLTWRWLTNSHKAKSALVNSKTELHKQKSPYAFLKSILVLSQILERGKKAVGLDGTDFDLIRSLITTRSGGLQEKLIHNPNNGYQAMTGGSKWKFHFMTRCID